MMSSPRSTTNATRSAKSTLVNRSAIVGDSRGMAEKNRKYVLRSLSRLWKVMRPSWSDGRMPRTWAVLPSASTTSASQLPMSGEVSGVTIGSEGPPPAHGRVDRAHGRPTRRRRLRPEPLADRCGGRRPDRCPQGGQVVAALEEHDRATGARCEGTDAG